jgi:hypothetical protein
MDDELIRSDDFERNSDGTPRHFYRDGTPILNEPLIPAWEKWALLLGDPNYKIVKQERTNYDELLSTVWLGIDHGFFTSTPIIFETMLFKPEDANAEDYPDNYRTQRYATEAEALAGHERLRILCLTPPKWRKYLDEEED